MPIETRICVAGEKRWRDAGTEPDLAEVLADPVVHLVMRRDGVSPCQLAIEFEAESAAEFVVGSAVRHDHDLVLRTHER